MAAYHSCAFRGLPLVEKSEPVSERIQMKTFAVFALSFAFVPATFAQTKPGQARDWEHESSDVPVNPRIRFGEFSNGFRYAWMSNGEPQKRCYLRLHVNVGSYGEEDSERGMAHFLEHMAFNGSKHFPAGTLIEWFQKHGMAFGADTNAHTSFSETVYKLDLPTSDEKTIEEGLTYFRDVADGLLLEEKEVEAEKGVIDGEERERDSAGFRVMKESLNKAFSGTRVPKRLPIGTKEARDKFSAKSVRAFYEKWYRPENMTLVISGDLGAFNPEGSIKKFFADFKAPASVPAPEPAVGTPKDVVQHFLIYEKEIPTVSISIEKLIPWKEEAVTKAWMTRDLGLSFARSMLNLRFSELAKKEGAPFLGARVGEGGGLKVYEGEELSITCQPDKWKDALALCEQELRRALEHGFEASELNEVRANYLRSLDESVDREKTRASLSFAEEILDAAEERSVPTTAELDRSVLRPAAEALTVEKCHKDFVKAWGEGELFVTATGNLDLGGEGGKILLETYEASRKVKVEARKTEAVAAFAYASDPAKAGKVKTRKHVEDLDFHQVEFENGVRLNVKKTDFKEKQIMISARLGEGRLTLEPAEAPMGMVASQVFANSGLGKHSEDDLRKLVAGKQVGASFTVSEDAFIASGGTTKEDLLLQCELMTAYMKDPGWREEGIRQYRKGLPQLFEMLLHQHQGPLAQKFLPAVYSNDPRFGLPAREKLESVSQEQMKTWLTEHLAAAPLDVTIVGDLDVESTVTACAQTFGALPKRRPLREYAERRKVPAPKSGIKMEEAIDTTIPKSLVMISFPTTDGIEAARRRNISFLNTIVNDRLRLEVREKLGASYSPGSGARMSSVHAGDGMIMIQAMSDPDKVTTLVDACVNVADALATKGTTQEEVDRLREPLLAQLRDTLRTNGHWIRTLDNCQLRPVVLDEARQLMPHYQGLKAETMNDLAKQYLKKDRASILIVNPAKKEEAKEEKKAEEKTGG